MTLCYIQIANDNLMPHIAGLVRNLATNTGRLPKKTVLPHSALCARCLQRQGCTSEHVLPCLKQHDARGIFSAKCPPPPLSKKGQLLSSLNRKADEDCMNKRPLTSGEENKQFDLSLLYLPEQSLTRWITCYCETSIS